MTVPYETPGFHPFQHLQKESFLSGSHISAVFASFSGLFPLFAHSLRIPWVVCSINKYHVSGIPDVVSGIRKPDIWKLYQVAYSSYGRDNRQLLMLSDNEFDAVVAQAEKSAQKRGIPLATLRRSSREGTYLFLEPNGDAMVIQQSEEIVIGNFFNDFDQVVSSWSKFVNDKNMKLNFHQTYPS